MATRDITSAIEGNLEDNVVYPFFATELLFDGSPLRLWTGPGTLVYDGVSWTGTGNLLDVSSVEETSEIAVRGATLTLTGVPAEVISLALQEPYQGRVANIYFGMFSKGSLLQEIGSVIQFIADFAQESYQLIRESESGSYLLLEDGSRIILESQETGLTQIFSGYMDEMNIDEGAETSTIELKVENKLIDLERARVRRFTSGYQKSVYPGDKGLDFVESLQDKEVVWGRKVED